MTPMANVEDVSADAPALQINHQLTAAVLDELRQRDLKKGNHGPSLVQKNPISSTLYDGSTHRMYIGMQNGEIFFWNIRRRCVDTSIAQISGHSEHRMVGRHMVRRDEDTFSVD
jgi:hypothetical protein